jgi:hypothetical protein
VGIGGRPGFRGIGDAVHVLREAEDDRAIGAGFRQVGQHALGRIALRLTVVPEVNVSVDDRHRITPERAEQSAGRESPAVLDSSRRETGPS